MNPKGMFQSGAAIMAPYAKEALSNLGKHALCGGVQVAGDVLQGRNIDESFKQRGKELGQGFLGEYGYQDYPTPQDYPPPPPPPPPNYGYASPYYAYQQPNPYYQYPPEPQEGGRRARPWKQRRNKKRKATEPQVSEPRARSKRRRRSEDIFD